MREYEAVLDRVATEWHAAGTINSAYAGLPFAQRFAHVLNAAGPAGYRPFDISLGGKMDRAEPMHQAMHLGPAVFDVITSPRLVDVVEQLIGPEVLSNPIQHVRIKPPEALLSPAFQGRNSMVSAVEWHQDQGVALPEVDETEMLTVWFPVFESSVENGCLCVVPESHKRGLLTHCPSRPGQTFDLRIPEVRARRRRHPGAHGAGERPLPAPAHDALLPAPTAPRACAGASTCATSPSGSPPGGPGSRSSSSAAGAIRSRRCTTGGSGPPSGRACATTWRSTPKTCEPRRWKGTEAVCA